MSRKQRLVLGFLLRPLLYCVYFVSRLFPRDRRLWVFGTWSGERLSDNSAALFRYCGSVNEHDIRCVWVTPNKTIRNQVREEGLEARHPWSIGGIATCLRAGIYVFDISIKDVNYWLSGGAKAVLLRHGAGIKKIARATDNPSSRKYKLYHGRWWEKAMLRFLLPWHMNRLDLVMATSEQHAAQAILFFDVERERIAVTGSPRNDILFSDNETTGSDPSSIWIDEFHANDKQVFIFMPTFRDDGRPAYPYSWQDLDELAGRLGIGIVARLHPVDNARPTAALCEQFNNIRMHEPAADPYPLFKKIDCLITDYSSVVYDFMLLRKPIIFFCPDLEEFLQKSRSFCYDYNEVTPAPKIRTLEELEEQIMDITSGSPALPQREEEYQSVLNRFHYFQDGNSSERCYEAILSHFVTQNDVNSCWSH